MKTDKYNYKNVIKDRLKETRLNYQGLKMNIIEYRSATDIDVKFEDGYIAYNKRYNTFKNGEIKSLLYPSVFSVGYLGVGKYKIKEENGKLFTQNYLRWISMIRRCYDEKHINRHKTYADCFICEEWHNFQNFAKWYDENYYQCGDEKMDLDKDILVKGNKLYSPNTCMFVPKRINVLFIRQSSSNKYPIGVTKSEKSNSLIVRAYSNDNLKCCYLGCYKTVEQAHYVYKMAKEKYIKQIADEYKQKYSNFPKKLYDAMYNYKIEITD